MALPDFLIAGAPKAGTTALHVALARHPQLYLSRVKEPKYFLTNGRPRAQGGPGDAKTLREQVWRRDGVRGAVRRRAAGHPVGESTSLYLNDTAALQRIQAAIPDVRIIALLRDPVDRAHSNWAHLWSGGSGAGARLRGGLPAGGQARRRGLGAVLAVPVPRASTASSSTTCGHFPARADARPALSRAARVTGRHARPHHHIPRGAPGVVTETTAENVTTHASPSLVNRAVAQALRVGSAGGPAAEPARPRRGTGEPLPVATPAARAARA